MEIVTRSSVEVSESLAAYLLGTYLSEVKGSDPKFEYRLQHVTTGKFSVADLYYEPNQMAIEVKSVAHGNSALKGVIQASMYKEEVDNAVLCMQKPQRRALAEGIESFAESHGVGVVWLVGVPTMCSKNTIKRATGGEQKPFERWKKNRYSRTKETIRANSRSHLVDEFLDTLDQVILEKNEEVFKFAVKPNEEVGGFSEIY